MPAPLTPGKVEVAPPLARLDRAAELVLIGLIAYLPLAFGGVLGSAHVVLQVSAAALAAWLGIRFALAGATQVPWSWTYVPILLFLALVALQVAPLPEGLMASIAPATAETWAHLLADPPVADETASRTLSLYPHATRGELRLLLAAGVVFLAAVQMGRSAGATRRLLLGVTVVGFAVAALAVVQNVSGARAIYGLVETPVGHARSGPFVHYGHFSQFVNLAMGAGLALLLARAADRAPGRRMELSVLADAGPLDRALAGFLLLGILAVALSLSRNGLMSMLFAGLLTVVALQRTRFLRGIGWPLVGLLFTAFLGLLFLGFDPVYDRMASLGEGSRTYVGRYELVRDSLQMAASFPLFGVGQGAFALTFPMFDAATRAGTAEHAENMYAEVLAETGVAGFALALGLVVLVARAGWRVLRRRRQERLSIHATAYGLGFGLVAVAFHATTDFGLKIPAVGMLTVVYCGLLVGLADPGVSTRTGARRIAAGIGFGACGLLIALLPATVRAWRAERYWSRVQVVEREIRPPQYRGTSEQYGRLVSNAERAAELAPGNVEYRHAAALHAWNDRVAAAGGYDRSGDVVSVEHTPELVAFARATRDRLLATRRAGPTFGPSWSIAGQLGVLWLDDPEAAGWIHRGRELAPHHPAACFASGVQFLREGRDAAATEDFRRGVQVGGNPRDAIDTLVHELARPDIARAIASGEPAWMVHLERRLRDLPGAEVLLEELRVDLRRQLESASIRLGVQPWMYSTLAELCEFAGDDDEAIDHYRTFLAYEPRSTRRYELALLLERNGRRDEAKRQARDLLSVHPGHGGAKVLLERLAQER